MSQYILINRIQVQNANAIAGFTWGFPAITHFLGFTHKLARKLSQNHEFGDILLGGCMVVAHTSQVHTYGKYEQQFTQTRNPPYLKSHNKKETPPVIEEGKMHLIISLLIEYEGNIGNREDTFLQWLHGNCRLQRLAGGTILDIKNIQVLSIETNIHQLKRSLLPGFVLVDKSEYLEQHYAKLQQENNQAELLDAWLDFIALKQKARPKSDIITQHLKKLAKENKDDERAKAWQLHLERPYQQENTAEELQILDEYFTNGDFDKKLLKQWQDYCQPTEETEADWEYLSKPYSGYLVPIMTGYKAISEVYKNHEIANTRDDETDVCFVEAVHSIGEWLSAHRLNQDNVDNFIWRYCYETNWYLCKQGVQMQEYPTKKSESSDDSF